jgi:CBS domain-containing protein
VEVGDLCNRNMVPIGAQASLVEAAQIMRKDHVGMLVVTQPAPDGHDSKVLGVLTDRDIVTAVVAKSADPDTLKVEDVMARNPIMVSDRHTLDHALRLMRETGVRRVPVLGNRDELVGVLSLDDVLEALATELGDVSQAIRSGQRLERRTRP